MKNKLFIQYHHTPIGKLGIIANDNSVVRILFESETAAVDIVEKENKILKQAKAELTEYFLGERQEFSLNVNPAGTDFQQQAWRELKKIPYGKTISYQEQAGNAGDAKKARAIGAANGKNPIPVIVPCHRVIGKNGSLTGFAGGLPTKKYLLEHEQKYYSGKDSAA